MDLVHRSLHQHYCRRCGTATGVWDECEHPTQWEIDSCWWCQQSAERRDARELAEDLARERLWP